MAAPSTLSVKRHDRVLMVTLNRPEQANSLDARMAGELGAVAADCDADSSIRAVVITATGRFFCAGGDVKSMAAAGEGAGPVLKRLADDFHRALSTLARMRAPVIVGVNGAAAGAGVSLAASGDIVAASTAASFTMAYGAVGLSPDGGSTHFLPRLIGMRRTQELMLTPRTLTAGEALEWGLVTRVVAPDALENTVMDLAKGIAGGSLEANAAVKRLLQQTYEHGLETQMELEGRAIAACAAGPDGQEGIRAFAERRAPRFR